MCEIHYRLRCPAVFFQLFERCMKNRIPAKIFHKTGREFFHLFLFLFRQLNKPVTIKEYIQFLIQLFNEKDIFISGMLKMSIYAISPV